MPRCGASNDTGPSRSSAKHSAIKFLIIDCKGQQKFTRRLAFTGVVLKDSLGQEAIVITQGVGQEKRLGAGNHASPDKEECHPYRGVLTMKAEHVLIQMMLGDNDLMFYGPCQPLDLIPVQGRFLKDQGFRGLFHLGGQFLDHFADFAFKDQQHIAHHALVVLGVHLTCTGCEAAAHLIVEARSRTFAHDLAAPQGKLGVEELQGDAHRGA